LFAKKKGEDVERHKTYRPGIAAGSPAWDGVRRAWRTVVLKNTHTARYFSLPEETIDRGPRSDGEKMIRSTEIKRKTEDPALEIIRDFGYN